MYHCTAGTCGQFLVLEAFSILSLFLDRILPEDTAYVAALVHLPYIFHSICLEETVLVTLVHLCAESNRFSLEYWILISSYVLALGVSLKDVLFMFS